MADRSFAAVLGYLRRRVDAGSADEPGDGLLVGRFATLRDEAAFETLLQRHGPMVLNLCRSVLRDVYAAEDAFQATFLILACRAGAIRKQKSVASWLYGVARRVALRARTQASRRRQQETQGAVEPSHEPADDLERQELRWLVADELQRLPEKYRAPLVLCYLEGKTSQQAARELGWPSGSMGKRLARGRELLRERLSARGVATPAGLFALGAAGSATAAVPAPLVSSTLRAVTLFAAGDAAASTPVVLAQGVLRAMSTAKLKLIFSTLLVVAVVALAAGRLTSHARAPGRADEPPITLPDDPHAVVLRLDYRAAGEVARERPPYLAIRADGLVVFGNPGGDSRRAEARLSAQELQALLRPILRANALGALDSRQLEAAMKEAALAKGVPAVAAKAPLVVLSVRAGGKEQEVRCRGLSEALARRFPEVKPLAELAAMQQRLERVAVWVRAGGHPGVQAALKTANGQLRRQFPEAPLLGADDLQSARLDSKGRCELVLERRGVAADKNPYSFVYARLDRPARGEAKVAVKANLAPAVAVEEQLPKGPIDCVPKPIARDATVKYDYDIIYVRAPRFVKGASGKDQQAQVWPNAAEPGNLRAPTDLMLLHPDGSEEVLVKGGTGAIADPYVSFDAQWVYYSYFHDTSGHGGADVYKVHVKTRKRVRLTRQEWTPNTGVPGWAAHFRTLDSGKTPRNGVYNMHPCPLPGGRVAFVSNRDGLKAPRGAQGALQLFVMDNDGANVEKIGHLNVGQALHPVVLKDGRIIFSSLEVQGKHNTGWGILGIHPDGTQWNPVVSALSLGGAPIPFHFQTQLSDGSIVVENYYVPAMGGFGVYFKLPPRPPEGVPAFGPAKVWDDPKMAMMHSRFRMPFQPYGMEVLTRFTHNHDSPSLRADPRDRKSPHTGWVTHPCGAPDNHLLTVWSGMMPANQGRITADKRGVDGGIYLIKAGRPFWEPGEMRLIKDDPKYSEQWPRPLVPYKRIYGVDEPRRLTALRNDGKLSKHLPEGTPFGLVGTSSLYKRESYPLGVVPKGSVTAIGTPYSAFPTREHRTNWDGQGAEAGLYSNSDIHAIRILALEPASLPVVGKFSNHAGERLRILGEVPVRKFPSPLTPLPPGERGRGEGGQPTDPDGNPDTSFLAKIPTDVAWTFQTLDKDGMVLNMAQTWHQLRPGEIRNNCGGCHAHSQQPTPFEKTAAAKKDYTIFDLTKQTPLLTSKANDQSGKKWDVKNETGLRYAKGVLNVEYQRDVRPIFERSCVACHSGKAARPAGNLVLDDDRPVRDFRVPGTYHTLVSGGYRKSTRYLWRSQSRNSLLAWKLFGRRTDGFPEKLVSSARGDYHGHLARGGDPFRPFKGSIMPPPRAVAGTYDGPDGKKIKVAPLSDEDRRTIVRWIDLGCPIDLDFDPKQPQRRGKGWMLDDQRPTLTLTYPRAGTNPPLSRILVGMHDYYSGLDRDSFRVVADFPVDGVAAGENLAKNFKALTGSRWELTLGKPIRDLRRGKLTVSVKDRQGNTTRIERTFSVGKP